VPHALQISDLSFTYPGDAFQLRLPQLTMSAGSTLALAGPSGAGKSTLLRLMTGLLTPKIGTVQLGQQNLAAMSREGLRAFRLQHVGLVFQDFALLDYLTVEENILLPHQFAQSKAPDISTLTQRLQIDRYHAKLVSQLSQGERQRVAVARALVHQPQFIFADEPTASLDPARGRIVVDLLIEDAKARGACLVMVTHDPGLLSHFDQTLHMEDLVAI